MRDKFAVSSCFFCDMEFVGGSGDEYVVCPYCGRRGEGIRTAKFPVNQSAADMLKKADRALAGGDFNAAEAGYKRALAFDGDNPYIHFNLALAKLGVRFRDRKPVSRAADKKMEDSEEYKTALKLEGDSLRSIGYKKICAEADGAGESEALKSRSSGEFDFVGTHLDYYGGQESEIVIPDGTTHIDGVALYFAADGCRVRIPASVHRIESKAFNPAIAEITVDENNRNYAVYGGCLVDIREGKLTAACKEFSLPDGVIKIIGEYALAEVKDARRIELPGGVRKIERNAFDCCGAESLFIPSTVEEIADAAFSNCKQLKDISVDGGNKRFYVDGGCLIERESGRLVFACVGCEIPEGVKSLGASCFNGGHKNLRFPASLESGLDHAFCGCVEIESLSVDEANDRYISLGECIFTRDGCELVKGCKNSVLPQDGALKKIGENAFAYAGGLRVLTLPEGVEEIGGFAFTSCRELKKVIMPRSLKRAGCYAFSFCSELTEVKLNEGVETLGSGLFDYCVALKSVKIPASVKEFDIDGFQYCKKLRSVELADVNGWRLNGVAVNPADLSDGKALDFFRDLTPCTDLMTKTDGD